MDWLGYFVDEAIDNGGEEQDLCDEDAADPDAGDTDDGEVVEEVASKSSARSSGRRSGLGRRRGDLDDDEGSDVEQGPRLLLDRLQPDQLQSVLSQVRVSAASNLDNFRTVLRMCEDSLRSPIHDKEHWNIIQRGG